MVTLCNDPNCNLLANHRGKHLFVFKKAWNKHFKKEDIKKIDKAGYCTPRGGDKGGYQNHVTRSSKVIIPFEKYQEVNLDNYKDGYVIRLYPSQYFTNNRDGDISFEKEYPNIKVGDNAFVLYRTYDDFNNYPPLPTWELRSILRYDKLRKAYCIPTDQRSGNIIDQGHYLLRISNSGTNRQQNRFEGPAQGIFAPEYADKKTNFLCQAVLAWLIIKTDNSPYNESDFEHLKAILQKHDLLDSPHFENDYILHNGITTCPLCQKAIQYSELNEMISFDNEEGLENSTDQVGSTRSTKVNLFHMVPLCYSSLENTPTQVSWGHATCNTRLGQRRCYPLSYLQSLQVKIEIIEGNEQCSLGYTNSDHSFIRSQDGEVWIRISKGCR